jgi:hypothetical protein
VLQKLSVLLLAAAMLARCGFAEPNEAAAEEGIAMDDVLVVINYFAGWWEPLPNKWHVPADHDWRADFPERVPLLGEYNTQDTMDREIGAAAEHGVDAFIILWYYNDPDREREANARFLNRGLTNFVSSPVAHRMRFMIEFCNHPPFEVKTDEEWSRCLEAWMPAFRHPSCLRVGGKIPFKVHGAYHFYMQNNQDIDRCREQLDALRRAVRDAGLGEMLIGGGVGSGGSIAPEHPYAQLFDFTCTYMDVPSLERKEEDYPYETLAEMARNGRKEHCDDAIPYVPYVPAGWNPKPWRDPRPSFSLPNRKQWERELIQVADDLKSCEKMGLPLPDGGRRKMFTIYAWNEFGEGGFVAPTKGEGSMKLEVIRELFGGASP